MERGHALLAGEPLKAVPVPDGARTITTEKRDVTVLTISINIIFPPYKSPLAYYSTVDASGIDFPNTAASACPADIPKKPP